MDSDLTMAADHLYGISMRPQELSLYGQEVTFQVSYTPLFDDGAAQSTQHFVLLVLEVWCEFEADNELARPAGQLELLKCGWEAELHSSTPIACQDLPLRAMDVQRLMQRIADTVNDLARRAGLEAPLGPELIDRLSRQILHDDPA